MNHIVGVAATISIIATVSLLIVSPMSAKRIADKIMIGGFVLVLGAVACLIAAMWIGMALGAAQMLGVVPFLLLCLLLQGRSKRN